MCCCILHLRGFIHILLISFKIILGLASPSLLSPYRVIAINVLFGFWRCRSSIIPWFAPVPLAIRDAVTEFRIVLIYLLTIKGEPTWSSDELTHDENGVLTFSI